MVAVGPTRGQSSPSWARRAASGWPGRVAASLAAGGWPLAEIATALAALLLYRPVLEFGFVFDDRALIGADGFPLPLGPGLPYRPLRYASYLVDALLGGTAAVYHAHNALLHAAVAALAAHLARRVGCRGLGALACGLLVAAHPLAVEAAAYVSGRRDLLAVALGLGALLALTAGRLGGAVLLLLLATAAKESALVFAAPMMAAVFAGVVPARNGPQAAPRAAAAIALGASAAFAMTLLYGAIGPWSPPWNAAGAAFPGHVVLHYASGLLGLRALSVDDGALLQMADRLRGGDAPALAIGCGVTLLLVAALGGAAWRCDQARRGMRRSAGALAAAWASVVLAAMATVGGLHEPGADRHAYLLLPAVGLALALVVDRAPRVARVTAAVAAAVWLPWCAASSRAQMQVWSSDRALWMHAAAHPPLSTRTRANVARVLAGEGRYGDARRHLDAGLAADPGEPLLRLGRAAVRCATGRRGAARRDLEAARRLGAPQAAVADVAQACPRPRPAARPRRSVPGEPPARLEAACCAGRHAASCPGSHAMLHATRRRMMEQAS